MVRCATLVLVLGALWPLRASACVEEAALAEVALVLATEPALDAAALTRALREEGSDLVHAWAHRFETEAEGEAWVASLEADSPVVCGIAHGEGSLLVVASARAGRLEVEGSVARASVTPGFRDAHLVVRDGTDALHRLALEGGQASLEGLTRPLVVQLVATGPRGPRPVAERRLGEPLRAPRVLGGGSLAQRLDLLREGHEASPLRPNRLLQEAADRHARAICRAGVAAHSLQRSDPESRLASQGVRARVVGEAVARVAFQADPLEALGESPGHAAALLDRRFTDVGVGEVRARGRRCVVVFLAAWPRYVGR